MNLRVNDKKLIILEHLEYKLVRLKGLLLSRIRLHDVEDRSCIFKQKEKKSKKKQKEKGTKKVKKKCKTVSSSL